MQLTAEIVNNPEVRETPRGRRLGGCNAESGKLHTGCKRAYPMCHFLAGGTSSEIAKYKRGTIVKITGRLQSREYVKKYYGDDGAESEEKRTTFEVSVEKMQVWWQPETSRKE